MSDPRIKKVGVHCSAEASTGYPTMVRAKTHGSTCRSMIRSKANLVWTMIVEAQTACARRLAG